VSNVVFFPKLYEPTEGQKTHFWYLQAATRNMIREIEQQEQSRYWQKSRIQEMVKLRREKFELIQGGLCDDT
jgi:hypothetical protein